MVQPHPGPKLLNETMNQTDWHKQPWNQAALKLRPFPSHYTYKWLFLTFCTRQKAFKQTHYRLPQVLFERKLKAYENVQSDFGYWLPQNNPVIDMKHLSNGKRHLYYSVTSPGRTDTGTRVDRSPPLNKANKPTVLRGKSDMMSRLHGWQETTLWPTRWSIRQTHHRARVCVCNTVVDRLMISVAIAVRLDSSLPPTRHILLPLPIMTASAITPTFASNEWDEWRIAILLF